MGKPSSIILAAVSVMLAAAGAAAQPVQLSAMAQLGRDMFFDRSLSGNGAMSCATCHDPEHHFAPANDRAVQMGGPAMDKPGIRAVPSLTYRSFTPAFSVGPADEASEAGDATPMAAANGAVSGGPAGPLGAAPPATGKTGTDNAANMVPRGGMFWDGRVDTLQDQAMGPLMSPFEMDNADITLLAEKIRRTYGERIAQLAGRTVLDDPEALVGEAGFAMARYQVEDPAFHPFNSRYDDYLAGRAVLTDRELRGLKVYEDRNRGNCADCHPNKPAADGTPPLFTDFQYEALGAPRNKAIPANADPGYFDLGICGPMRGDDYAKEKANCGLFKTPSLRNAASRGVFFHNGVFHSLEDVMRFYAERNTDPGRFYPKGENGKVEAYDDMPAAYRANIDVIDPPFNRKAGDKPALNDQDIADLVAFLKTLNDR
ncbi:MAG TPA: cytochrome c peroxidase [Ensifer sp.]|nr:cytochrome c peroxidase [Ensifer sp.]